MQDERRTYLTTTRGLEIAVVPVYDEERSKPETGNYLYGYTITIRNTGEETVQLVSRHWVIRDGFNRVEHVVGEGVVGKQPILAPGESFTYSSFCPLQTPTGSMEGTYQMRTKAGEVFDALIGRFDLAHKMLMN